jgi:putative flippase GtrA
VEPSKKASTTEDLAVGGDGRQPADPDIEPAAAAPRLLDRASRLVAWIRSPDLGLLGQGMRYVIAGSTVTCVYLATTLILTHVAGLPFQAALAIGFTSALVTHFTLQRFFVWVHHEEFALPIRHQLGRYLTIAAIQYGTTAAATDLLPKAIGLPTTVIYLAVVGGWTVSNFVVFRLAIFHPSDQPS